MSLPSNRKPLLLQPRASSRWLWCLAGLSGLFLAAFVGLVIFNSQKRLTQDKLDLAKARWTAANIRDYDAEITVSGTTSATCHVEVRNNSVFWALHNEQPLEMEQASYWTVPGLFDVLNRDLKNDAEPGSPRALTRVTFDPNDGHLVHYLRSRDRQNIVIDFKLHREPSEEGNPYRLTQQRLHAARSRWEAAAMHDYDLDVTVTRPPPQSHNVGEYHLKVREDKIVEALSGKLPLDPAEPWTVAGLFEILELDVERDAKASGPPAKTRVAFHPELGHLTRYVRISGEQNIDLRVMLTSVSAPPAKTRAAFHPELGRLTSVSP